MPPGIHKLRHLGQRCGLGAALCLLISGCAPFSGHPGAAPSRQTPPRGGPAFSGKGRPCGNVGAGSSYVVFGRRYHVLDSAAGYNERGIASWYGRHFHGKLTSSGVPYDMYAATAASKVLPLCTWVKVTNIENGKTTVVQVNDRGPFVATRIIDLSYAAAQKIGMMRKGTALVNVRALAAPSRSPPRDIEKISREAPTPELHHHPRIYLQLGAFTHHEYAEKLRAELLMKQVGKVRIEPARVHGRKFYRVQVGPYGTVDAIDALAARLAKLGYHDTEVVIE